MEENKKKPSKKEPNKKLMIVVISAISVFVAVALVVVAIFSMSYYNRQKEIKQADSLILIESYSDGIAMYDNLLRKKHSLDIIQKRNLAIELMESDENLRKGIEASEGGDIKSAIRYLSRVPKEDNPKYKKAIEELENIEETAYMDIQQLIESGELEVASQKVNEYLKIDAKSEKVKETKESIATMKVEAENQAAQQAEAERIKKEEAAANAAKQAEAEAASARKKIETSNTANNLIGTYKSIISDEANLRAAPTLKSEVISVLNRGTEVYIHDTQIETADRIWCNVSVWLDGYDGYEEYGWISYNTMNYEIQ